MLKILIILQGEDFDAEVLVTKASTELDVLIILEGDNLEQKIFVMETC